MQLNSSICENGDVIVASGGSLTIETSAEFSRIVREALEMSENVLIEFDPAVKVDITGVQILCSACKSAAQSGKTFSFIGRQPQALADMIAASGAERHTFCKHNNNNTCNWFGGAN